MDNASIVITIDSEPLSIDPTYLHDYTGTVMAQALFEPLFVFDGNTCVVSDGVAVSYDVSQDGLNYEFQLRESYWSDGTPVTAHHFLFSFRRLISPINNASSKSLAYVIHNAEEIAAGAEQNIDLLGVTALDDQRLHIELAHPAPYLINLLANPLFSPLPRHVIEKYGDTWMLPENIVTNGPFILQCYDKSTQKIILTKNPYYRNSAEKKLQKVTFSIVNDAALQETLYKSGQIDITCNTLFNYRRIDSYKGNNELYIQPIAMLQAILLNLKSVDAFQDVTIRRLLYQSINTDLIASELNYGVSPSHGFIPDGISIAAAKKPPLSDSKKSPSRFQDLTRLRDRPVDIIFADYYPNAEVVSMIAKMWRDHLGMKVRLHELPLPEMVKRLNENNYDVCFTLLPAMYDDPMAIFQSVFEEGAFSSPSHSPETLVNLLTAAVYEEDPIKRATIYQQIDSMLLAVLPFLPLLNSKSIYLKKPHIRGFSISNTGAFSFSTLDLVEKGGRK